MRQLDTLPDLTRMMAQNKALAQTADRLIALALERGPALMRKAAVPAVGTGDVSAFVEDPDARPLVDQVQRRSVPGRLLALGATRVPPFQRIPSHIDDPEPAWVADGAPIPLARLSSASAYADGKKYALMLAYTKELLTLADGRARNLILNRSTRALVKADDAVFLSASAATAAAPAGLLWNRSAIGSGSPADLSDDLEELVASVSDGDPYSPVFLVSARGAAFLNASDVHAFRDVGLTGGTIAGAPAVVSRAAADNLILVDASELAITDEGVEVMTSGNAAIEMLDNPTNSSATPTATQVVSAFQTGTAILRYVRYLSWATLRDDAVAFLSLPIGGSPA